MNQTRIARSELRGRTACKSEQTTFTVQPISSRYYSAYVFFLVVVLSLVFTPLGLSDSNDIPKITGHVNDFPPLLLADYRDDLEVRLKVFKEKTGYAIFIVAISNVEGKDINQLAAKVFESQQLGAKAANGTILVLISKKEQQVAIVTNGNLDQKFQKAEIRERVQSAFKRSIEGHEGGMETGVQSLVAVIDPWFTALDPPSNRLRFGSQSIEIVLIFLAPLLGLVMGFLLAITSRLAQFRKFLRYFVAGCLGALVAVIAVFIMRRPGGVRVELLYYSAIAGFIASAVVVAFGPLLRPHKFSGKSEEDRIRTPYIGE